MKRDIKTLLYSTIHRNKKSIDHIADEIGISSNSLYRYCLDGESGAEMPLKRLVPLMNATKNFELLKHIAHISGFLIIKEPKGHFSKSEKIDIVDNYQDVTITAQKLIKTYFKNPSQDNYQKVQDMLLEVMEKSATTQKYIDKHQQGQLEFNL